MKRLSNKKQLELLEEMLSLLWKEYWRQLPVRILFFFDYRGYSLCKYYKEASGYPGLRPHRNMLRNLPFLFRYYRRYKNRNTFWYTGYWFHQHDFWLRRKILKLAIKDVKQEMLT